MTKVRVDWFPAPARWVAAGLAGVVVQDAPERGEQ